MADRNARPDAETIAEGIRIAQEKQDAKSDAQTNRTCSGCGAGCLTWLGISAIAVYVFKITMEGTGGWIMGIFALTVAIVVGVFVYNSVGSK